MAAASVSSPVDSVGRACESLNPFQGRNGEECTGISRSRGRGSRRDWGFLLLSCSLALWAWAWASLGTAALGLQERSRFSYGRDVNIAVPSSSAVCHSFSERKKKKIEN